MRLRPAFCLSRSLGKPGVTSKARVAHRQSGRGFTPGARSAGPNPRDFDMAVLLPPDQGLIRVQREIGGRQLILETGVVAKQASGAVVAYYGGSAVLATVVRAAPREGIDFFPLTVDYREKTSAAGKFPGGFRKREGAPNEKEILTMRMIDRPIRPLFPDGFLDEVQIQVFVMSHDGENDTD